MNDVLVKRFCIKKKFISRLKIREIDVVIIKKKQEAVYGSVI